MREIRQAYKLLAESLNIVTDQKNRHDESDWMQKHRLVVAEASIKGAMANILNVMERGVMVER